MGKRKKKKSLAVIIKLTFYSENWSLKKHIYPAFSVGTTV